jgi:hypothetical protein
MSLIAVVNEKDEGLKELTIPLSADPNDSQFDIKSSRGPLGQRLLSADLIGQAELESALKHQAESGYKLG